MLIMIRLALSEEEMVDIAEALDDPMRQRIENEVIGASYAQ